MPATDAQVQGFVDGRVRPSCGEIVLWVMRRRADVANIDDIYAALNVQSPTWVDTNDGNAAHKAVASDVLAWNAYIQNLLTILTGATTDANAALAMVQNIQGQWPVIQKLPLVPSV